MMMMMMMMMMIIIIIIIGPNSFYLYLYDKTKTLLGFLGFHFFNLYGFVSLLGTIM
jgi:hypothetical protein